MRAFVYTSHLYGLGGGARAALDIAGAMSHFMPTVVGASIHPPLSVQDWMKECATPNLSFTHYRAGMERDGFDIIWNVDHILYMEPAAKRNLAFIFFPRRENVAPPQYELYGVSEYSSQRVETAWEQPCQTLYLPVHAQQQVRPKKQQILNVSRFAAPSVYADKGHQYMIDAFKLISDAGGGWELTLIGGMDYGQGQYLDRLNMQARDYPVRIMVNAPQDVVDKAFAESAIYWHPTGIGMPNEPGAQEHYGLSILEAMRHGAVPVAIGRGGPCEIIRHGYDGMLFTEPQGLYDLTLGLIRILPGWSLLSQRARVSSVPFGDWNGFLGRMEAILSKKPIPSIERSLWLSAYSSPGEVCAVIPVHNQAVFTERCLNRLWSTVPQIKVILVDNASTDITPFLRERIEDHGGVYLRREVNNGYAASNMAALPFCDRPYVLMLNNDVEPLAHNPEWLEILLAEMRNPHVGIVGPKLLFPDGRIQSAGTEYDQSREELFYHAGYGLPDSPGYSERREPVAVTGACLLCRRELFSLDVSMALNYEDVAMCLQAKQKGYKIVYQPAATLVHYEARTKASDPEAKIKIAASKAAFLEKYAELLP